MPHKIWTVGEEVVAADFATYLQDQTVPQFPNVAARDTWAAPPKGALCVVTDTTPPTMYLYDGTAWRYAGGAKGIVARGVTPDGTDFASTAPVQVDVRFPAEAGRSYLLTAFTTAYADGSTAATNWAVAVNAVVQTNLRYSHIQGLTPTDTIQVSVPYHSTVTNPALPFTVAGSRLSGTATIRPGVWVWAVYDEGPTPAATVLAATPAKRTRKKAKKK